MHLHPAIAVAAIAAMIGVGCGGGYEPYLNVSLDVHGASNSQCSLTLANGGRSIVFPIGAPVPAVMDTSLAPLASPTTCVLRASDAGDTTVASPSGATAMLARTATSLCLVSFDTQVMTQLGYGSGGGNACPVVLTLTCGGVTLYDRVPWTACRFFG